MYHLIDKTGKLYDSETPGKFGGHKKQKIYGIIMTIKNPSGEEDGKRGKYHNF